MTSSRFHNTAQDTTAKPVHLLVGDSQPIREVGREILLIARNDATVLITGESGAGKELVAQAIHRNSNRAGGPFKVINCGSVTESLLEDRLFGHVKGAFTGANGAQAGLFEAANEGTIFLDEIGDMPMQLQTHLLRVLQERTILPVGARTERKVNVRVITATNKDLQSEVREGRFRQDLYYRLNEFPIQVPALRERPSDIPLLISHFLGSTEIEIEEEAYTLLRSYHWPGNVRELKNTISRLALRAQASGNQRITADQVSRDIGPGVRDVITFTFELRRGEPLDCQFNQHKLAALNKLVSISGGPSKAARWLGMTPEAFSHRMRRLR
jgi:transcriptional regulator with GAF, ATPase, and Fis domain